MNVTRAIQAWHQRPFARGISDCCAFVDYILVSLYGRSYLPQYGADDFQDILDRWGSLSAAVSHYAGRPLVDVDELKPGDIALVTIRGHESIGILTDQNTVAVVFEGAGLREIGLDFVDGGWSWG